MMKKWVVAAVLAAEWFVVTYSGQRVAGPFRLLSDCEDIRKEMAKRYYNIKSICESGR